jgi:hypothetical protein
VDPDIVQKILPSPFKPKLYKNKAIVGICLIRLKQIRPKGLPGMLGISSENGAHRIAVEWENGDKKYEGVFVRRRDTSSFLNTLAGGRIFPGKHHHAKFDVKEGSGRYQISFRNSDGTTISFDGTSCKQLPSTSVFGSLKEASDFFERGSIGYSPNGEKFEGLELRTSNWLVEPMEIRSVQSSFFEDDKVFPNGSVKFDNALLMTKIDHEWHSVDADRHCL